MADMVCELLTEEIPARLQAAAEQAFLQAITQGLTHKGLPFSKGYSLSTPRRLAVIIKGIPPVQPDTRTERKGPSITAPEHAIQGFLRSVGLRKDQLHIRNTPKGRVYFAVTEHKGQATPTLLPPIINTAIGAIAWAKSMRFADDTFRFVRPLQRIIAVFDAQVICGSLPLNGNKTLPYTDKTLGHRFMTADDIPVTAHNYKTALANAHIMVNRTDRKHHIIDGLQSQAAAKGVQWIGDATLLDEVVGLVESPVVLMGDIPPQFMCLPKEVLITALKQHQKFFVFEASDGTLAPYFATVANIHACDGGQAIIRGNEKVLSARLSDSVFFWDNDHKNWAVYTQNTGLATMTFHAKLGTVQDRVYRLRRIGKNIAESLQYDTDTQAKVSKSAQICKSDLVSEMVFEFPELQGIMGAYYAEQAGTDTHIARAIRDHYKPRGANDAVPTDPVTIPLAIAEKLDTLCGFWLIDEKPTGRKDPYALRRCALGILRIILKNALYLNIMAIVDKAFTIYAEQGIIVDDIHMIRHDLQTFLIDRLKHALKSEGIRHDYIGAVLSDGLDATLIDKVHLARTMGQNTAIVSMAKTAYTRANSILQQAPDMPSPKIHKEYLKHPAEQALYEVITDAQHTLDTAHANKDFKAIIHILSTINTPLNQFFDNIMVHTDDPHIRHNRLALLRAVTNRFHSITNFNSIEK